MQNNKTRLIWDLPLRLFHWLLVFAIVAQWATAEYFEDQMDWHFYIGYFTLGLILFRLLWGFFGPHYSRFSQFLVSPKALWHYLTSLRKPNQRAYLGHNPVGSLIVPLVIIVIGFQAVTGLFSSDDVLHSGPYMSVVSSDTQALLDTLHHKIFDVITGIVVIHLIAIICHQFIGKQRIIKAMFTGRKPGDSDEAIKSSRLLLAFVLVVCIGIAIYALVTLAPVPEEFYF